MPSHLKPSHAADELAKRRKRRPLRRVFIALAVLLAAAAGYLLYSRFTPRTAPQTADISSVAVLAFEDMTPEKDMEHVGDGIADAIIGALTQIDGLRVPARNSAFVFKGQYKNIREIGRQLDVDTVLEGGIQRSGDRLRITAQLIRVDDDRHLFSKTYEHFVMEDIFTVQDEIATRIVEALKGEILGEEKAVIAKRPTDNSEAYELYLKGHPHVNIGRGRQGLFEDIDFFNMALQKDPGFALAHVGIAYKYIWMGYNAIMPPREAYPKAREATEKALEIDGSLAEAYTQRGWTRLYYDWDLPGAERNFRRAIELNPRSFLAIRWYKDYFMVTGDFENALELVKKARKLDPLATSLGQVAQQANWAGHFDEARELLARAKEIDPYHSWVRIAERELYLMTGDYDRALEVTKRMRDEESIGGWYYYGPVYALMGEKEKAKRIIEKCVSYDEKEYYAAHAIARMYMLLGDFDKTFEWLEKSYDRRESYLLYINSFWTWEPIRSDPRYTALLKKMGLPGKRGE